MLDPSTVAPTPWRNGAGSTRELAVATDPDGRTRWRISVAALDRDAPFSLFPDMDRLFVALGPLRLTVEGVVTTMAVGDQARFVGEASAAVALYEPTTALNVITRRGRCHAEVALRRTDQPVPKGVDATIALAGMAADVRFLAPTEDADD
jgi:environmental stress-induced protein Ves